MAALGAALTAAAQPETSVILPKGVAYQADFSVTGFPKAASCYALSGLPPGLAVSGASYASGTDTYSVNSPFGTISGTPTTVGSFALNLTAWESTDRAGASRTYTYNLVVTDGVTPIPVIATPVASAVVTAGHDASFSAGNTAGSLQWQVSSDGGISWSNIANSATYAGATSSSLTVAGAGMSLNGARYRVQVQSGGAIATSNAATLTVQSAFFPFPAGVVVDASGNLLVADAHSNTISKVSPAGEVSLVAGGSGAAGSADGSGATARFNQPAGVAVSSAGVIFVADAANATVRRIGADGVVTTLVGSPSVRGSNDGTGAAAQFSQPAGLALDASGALYVADAMNHTIRKVTSGGVVTTVAGSAGSAGATDGPGNLARFNLPSGVTVGAGGTLWIADTVNHTIRTLSSAGAVTTLAGLPGVSGNSDGVGVNALFSRPAAVAMDGAGNLYVTDTANSTIRRITPGGLVTTLAGLPGIAGLMDGTGSYALFNQPQALAIDASGNLYVADTGNAALRKVTPAGVVTTLVLTAAPVTTPVTNPVPTPTPVTPSPTPAASGGGGGGGAPSLWFVGAMLALLAGRVRHGRSADSV